MSFLGPLGLKSRNSMTPLLQMPVFMYTIRFDTQKPRYRQSPNPGKESTKSVLNATPNLGGLMGAAPFDKSDFLRDLDQLEKQLTREIPSQRCLVEHFWSVFPHCARKCDVPFHDLIVFLLTSSNGRRILLMLGGLIWRTGTSIGALTDPATRFTVHFDARPRTEQCAWRGPARFGHHTEPKIDPHVPHDSPRRRGW